MTMSFLNDIINLFYPKVCALCSNQLVENENVLCTFCRHDLALTNFKSFTNNKVTQSFYGKLPIEKGYALLFYRKEGSTQHLIHQLKYYGKQEIGTFFGDWLGSLLATSKEFNSIDFLIPVPLHKKRLKKRGYNQVTTFGKRLSYHLQKPFLENYLTRVSSTKTQTFKARFERFTNVNTKFSIRKKEKFVNKHIVLIDDVITTGATLEACANEFLTISGCKISVLTIAFTE